MSAETLLNNDNITLGFDATTQAGTHINSVHVTDYPSACQLLGFDELAGDTAEDYAGDINDTIERINVFIANCTMLTLKKIIKNVNKYI